jgi:hypothetical protein
MAKLPFTLEVLKPCMMQSTVFTYGVASQNIYAIPKCDRSINMAQQIPASLMVK